MLTQTRQMRITLSNLESNIRTLLSEREQFIKEFERLTKENEDLKNQISKKLKEEVK